MLTNLSYDEFLALGNEVIARLKSTRFSKTVDELCEITGSSRFCPSCGCDSLARDGAKEIGVNPYTAFVWRHKFMEAVSLFRKDQRFRGTVWVDGVYWRENCKGPGYIPRRHRHSAQDFVTGVDRHSSALVVVDSWDDAECRVSASTSAGVADAEPYFASGIGRDSAIVTNGFAGFVSLAEKYGFRHVEWPSGLIETPEYRKAMQPLNDECSAAKSFTSRFRGVATKYLQGYLDLYCFLKQTKYRKDEKDVIIFMLSFVAASKSRLRIRDLYDYK